MDILIEIGENSWRELMATFLNDWPRSAPGYYWLDTQINKPGLRKELNFKAFCPYGDIRNGMVIFVERPNSNCVGVYLSTDESPQMEEALASTKLIDWTASVMSPCTPSNAIKCLEKVSKRLGLSLDLGLCTDVIRRKEQEYYNVESIPEGTTLAPLTLKHTKEVNDLWAHKYNSSDWLIGQMIKHNQSWGLYSKETEELIAWVLISECGFLCHLYCKDAYRKKGYAEFLVKTAFNDLKRDDKDAYCFIVEGNTSSERLFRKLEFEFHDDSAWCFISPVKDS